MPPRGVKSQKRTRQYEHVKDSELARGVSPRRAKEIAARTVNKQRSKTGETKSAPRRAVAGKTSRKKSTGSTTRSRTGSTRSRSGSSRSRAGGSSRGKR
ncbi:hypothetical protein [Hyalangium gracile]|uniref:hypothetical protein n=1 Tax=Hyalangium gracile TaxID=394092 RepID=UPI001CC9092F|nr:hypothetical protein [Hyalangium gracile]